MIIVAAALIENGDRILLAERPEGVHLAGLWEFPGGKLEPEETPDACLRRELTEELGVTTLSTEPLTSRRSGSISNVASPLAIALPPELMSTVAVAVGGKVKRPSPVRVVAVNSTSISRDVSGSSRTL